MKYLYLTLLSLTILVAQAQQPEDALKLTYQPQFGTARNMAIGGAMIGLGGEITAAHTNPAGLGFYKNGEFVLSPGLTLINKNTYNYRGTNNQDNAKGNQNVNMGTSGLVLAGKIDGRKTKSIALSLTANKIADYNNNFAYKGFNNNSSAAERYAEEFSAAKQTIDQAIDNPFLSLGTRLALYTYLVDTLTLGGRKQVVAMPEFTNGVNQTRNEITTGGANEYSLGIAANKDEKLFVGGSLSIPIIRYNRTTNYSETDAANTPNNGFNNYTFTETLQTRGTGVNIKLGLIYRPIEQLRIGATIHSPSVYSMNDRSTGSMFTRTENLPSITPRTLANTSNFSEQVFTNGAPNISNKYTFTTPWKLGAGISYVFRETENVKRQRAFIAADIEYVTNTTMQYTGVDADGNTTAQYAATNAAIKDIYRNTINAKIGAELKMNIFMLRAGAAYFGNPNKDASTLKQNRVHLSAGLGYRHKGIFIDATYVHQMGNVVDMPYRLGDKPNTFATGTSTVGMAMLTIGTKF